MYKNSFPNFGGGNPFVEHSMSDSQRFFTPPGRRLNAGRPAFVGRFAGCNLWTDANKPHHRRLQIL